MSRDNATQRSRREALTDLLQLRRPVQDAIEELRRFSWDYPEELVTLTVRDALRVLGLYRQGRLRAWEFEAWADAIEVRDDVGLDAKHHDILREFLFRFSTPELLWPLSEELAEDWERRLHDGER